MSGLDQALVAAFLFLTMLGMGAALSVDDFLRVAKRPRTLLVGLASQYGWMPLVAFGLATLLGLPNTLAIGLIVMGCSSGGTTSNLFSFWAGADLALSISMTLVSTVAAFVLMPLVLTLYTAPFTGEELEIPISNVILTLVAVLIPVSAGVALRSWRPAAAERAVRVGSLSGIAVILLVIVSNALEDADMIASFTAAEWFAAAALGPFGFAFGALGAALAGAGVPQRRAITLETGIQNAPLALGIIIASFTGAAQAEILRIPLLYGVLVVPASALVAWAYRRLAGSA